MKTLILLPFLAIFALGCTNPITKKLKDLDSLEVQYNVLMENYTVDTYDSITPLLEENIRIRTELLY